MRKALSTLAATLILLQASSPTAAQNAPGPAEQVFVALAQPCRIFDSHATSALPNNTDTNAFINLTGYNYPSQGGVSGGLERGAIPWRHGGCVDGARVAGMEGVLAAGSTRLE